MADAVTSNGDASAVLLRFVGADLAYNPGVGDVTPAVLGNSMEVNGPEGICAHDAWLGRVLGIHADTLAEASQFVGVGSVPYCFVGGVPMQLAMFEEFSGGGVEDGGC